MNDQNLNNLPDALRKALLAAERLEASLDQIMGRLQPPYGAAQRLLAKLEPAFHERELMLDGVDTGPINFEQAVAAMQAEQAEDSTSDLLAAGLEEEEIDDSIQDENV